MLFTKQRMIEALEAESRALAAQCDALRADNARQHTENMKLYAENAKLQAEKRMWAMNRNAVQYGRIVAPQANEEAEGNPQNTPQQEWEAQREKKLAEQWERFWNYSGKQAKA